MSRSVCSECLCPYGDDGKCGCESEKELTYGYDGECGCESENELIELDKLAFDYKLYRDGAFIHFKKLTTEIKQLKEELSEQARLVGMSGERELKLTAKVQQLEHLLAQAREQSTMLSKKLAEHDKMVKQVAVHLLRGLLLEHDQATAQFIGSVE